MGIQIHIGLPKQDDIYKLRRAAGIPRTPIGKRAITEKHEDRRCQQVGWDTDLNKSEQCGAIYIEQGCKCHPNFCPECSAEVHNIDLTLPGVLESSASERMCKLNLDRGK